MKIITDDGAEVEMDSIGFEPFSFEELVLNNNSYNLKAKVKKVKINGLSENQLSSLNGTIEFHHRPTPFALVNGGWLPMPLAHGKNFLVDRNVIENIKQIIVKGDKHEDFQFWARFLNKGGIELNPLLYAFEGNKQKRPTFGAFIEEFSKAQTIISNYGFSTRSYDLERYKAAYYELKATEERYEKYSNFLLETAPLLINTVKRGEEISKFFELEHIRERYLVESHSLVYILVLTYLFEVSDKYCLGRKILKFSRKYRKKNTYNSLSDLYNLEFSVAINSIDYSNQYLLTTCDEGLAALWCALNPSGQYINQKLQINYRFDPYAVFPRLMCDSLSDLKDEVIDILQGK